MALTDNHVSDFDSFKFGDNFSIGHFNRIGKNVHIGDNVIIGHHCIVDDDVAIGNNVVIENYVLLKKNTNICNNVFVDSYVRSSGHNHIGDSVTLRYGSTIAKKVRIEESVYISPNVMTVYSTHEGGFINETIVQHDAFLGTAAVLGAGVNIGPEVVIGAMAYVCRDCLEKVSM